MSSIRVVVYNCQVGPILEAALYYRKPAEGGVVQETNTNFIARFQPIYPRWFRYNSWDSGVPQPETNVSFVGRFRPTVYRHGFQYSTTWDSGVPQPETNVSFVGRFRPTVLYTRFRYNNWDTRVPTPVSLAPTRVSLRFHISPLLAIRATANSPRDPLFLTVDTELQTSYWPGRS